MGNAYITDRTSVGPSSHLASDQQAAELEIIYDAAPFGIFLCDRYCRFIRVNRHLAEMDGIAAQDHVGKLAWEVIPALQSTLEPLYRRVLDQGETVIKIEVEGETPKAPGVLRFWEASYYPLCDAGGQVVAMCGIVDEITDRKAAEKERANSEARLKRLMESNLFGVVTATLRGITHANDAFLAILGLSREEFLEQGVDWQRITPPEHLVKDMAAVDRLKETGVCPGFEKEYIRKNGQRVPVLTGATLLDHKPLRWIAFVIDLSEQKVIEERNRELLREMTHRTKNLMAVISAIARQVAGTSDNLEEFNGRFNSRLHALSGIHDILVREDWRGADLTELIRCQLAHCADLIGHRINLDGPQLSVCATAAQYIGMAIYELSTNALKYGSLSRDTGTVSLRWSRKPTCELAPLTVEWIEEGGPVVTKPTREGFGHKVTTQFMVRALEAQVAQEFRKPGLRWSAVIPASYMLGVCTAQGTSIGRLSSQDAHLA